MGCPFKVKRVKFCPLCGGQKLTSKGNGSHHCSVCDELIEVCDYRKRIEQKLYRARKANP